VLTPVETEIKLELPSSEVTKLKEFALLRDAKAAKRATQVSVYFDTDKLALRKSDVMFRVRHASAFRLRQARTTQGSRQLEIGVWFTTCV
jgi:inorganic triphosphatase YgiF